MKQSLEEFFGNVSFIPIEFAKLFFDESRHFQRFSIISIAGRKHKIDYMTAVAGNQMQFKSIEPANSTLPTSGQSVKVLVGVDAAIMAHTKWSGLDKGNTGALAVVLVLR